MVRKTLCVLMCVICGVIVVAMTFAGDSASDESFNKQLESLLQQRKDTLEALLKITEAQYKRGIVPFEAVATAIDRLLDAKLDLARTKQERIALYEEKVAVLRGVEKANEKRMAVGKASSPTAVLDALAARLKAEIELLREKNSAK